MTAFILLAEAWWPLYAVHMVETSLFILLIWAVDRWVTLDTRLRYSLWLLALVKTFVPPFYALPLPAFLFAPDSSVVSVSLNEPIVYSSPELIEASVLMPQSIPWVVYVFAVWVTSAVGMAGITLWRNAKFRRALAAANPVDLSNDVGQLNGVSHLKVFAKANLHSPLLIGLVRPRLYLPSHWRTWTPEQLRGVVAHELAHHQNRDVWALAFQIVALVLFGLNPLIWLVNRQLGHLRELRCDEEALRLSGVSPVAYGKLLFDFLDNRARPTLTALCFTEQGSSLKKRFEYVLNFKEGTMKRSRRHLALLVLIGLAIGPLSVRETYSQPQASDESSVQVSKKKLSELWINAKGEMLLNEEKQVSMANLATELEKLKRENGTQVMKIKLDIDTPAKYAHEAKHIIQKANLKIAADAHALEILSGKDPTLDTEWKEGKIFEFNQVDTKPEPIHHVAPQYPEIVRKIGFSGKVLLKFKVNMDGSVSDVSVWGGPEVFHKAAIDAILQFKFKPAEHQGHIVPVWMTQPMTFQLQGDNKAQTQETKSSGAIVNDGAIEFFQADIWPVVIHGVNPEYPESAREIGLSGKVFVKFKVNVDGSVSDVSVLKGEAVFHQAAIDAMLKCKFKPAEHQGHIVPVWMTQPMSFQLDDMKTGKTPTPPSSGVEVTQKQYEFKLLANHPNPFNPDTMIPYELAEQTFVKLEIYNVTGQVVRTLVSEQQAAGQYQVRWNGQDESGKAVASGIYYYHLTTDKFSDVGKMQLLK